MVHGVNWPLNYHTRNRGVDLLKIGFLVCPTTMGGQPSLAWTDPGFKTTCLMSIPYLRSQDSLNVEGVKRRVPVFKPAFKISSNTHQAKELLI